MSDQTEPTSTPERQLTREELRALVLGAKPGRKKVTYNGAALELVEPSVGEVLDFQASEDRKAATAMMIVRYLHVPGTNERLLDETDMEAILTAPFSQDFQNLINAINGMIGVTVSADDKSLASEQSDAMGDPDNS